MPHIEFASTECYIYNKYCPDLLMINSITWRYTDWGEFFCPSAQYLVLLCEIPILRAWQTLIDPSKAEDKEVTSGMEFTGTVGCIS